MAVGGEEVEEEGLGFAFFVTFEFGGEAGESVKGFFLRGHGACGRRVAKFRGWGKGTE